MAVKPVIALVGRPNVGKSTLFNRLTASRDAIVADYAGLTRDRHYGNGRVGRREYIVIDTGGFEPDATEGIYKEMAKQTRQAVAESDVVLFVVDARAGISAQDHEIASYLRRLGKPCVLVANKAEGMTQGLQLVEFYELGLGDVLPVSASHGQGIRDMMAQALAPLNLADPDEEDDEAGTDGEGDKSQAYGARPAVLGMQQAHRENEQNCQHDNDRPAGTTDAIQAHLNSQDSLIDGAGQCGIHGVVAMCPAEGDELLLAVRAVALDLTFR